MPVKSYLAFPRKGKQHELSDALSQLPWCEVTKAQNENLLVLVTDTFDDQEEEQCLEKVNNIQSLEHLTLVSGFKENKN